MKLYENIRSKRLEYSWTQSDLAKRMGYSGQLLPLIEVGASKGQKPLFKKFDI